ncbi:MAG TPA: hypothetical protein VNM34_14855 [Verrucomicrobiae bacterium]|nr:hypothetical protein [Verrucomicrobiae bacterium]
MTHHLERTFTRAEYDALLPMSSVRRAAWGRAKRRWSARRVVVRFEFHSHLEAFIRDKQFSSESYDALPLRTVDREFKVLVVDRAGVPGPHEWMALEGLPSLVAGARWQLALAARRRAGVVEFARAVLDERLGAAVVPGDAPGLRFVRGDGSLLDGGAR